MVTKTEISKSSIGSKTGYTFSVYYNGRSYPNFVSGLVKTERGARRNLKRYLKTGEFSVYGNAE
jgi:hypothetical protein